MHRVVTKSLVVITLSLAYYIPSTSHAISFNEMEEWNSTKKYIRGEVVTVGYDMYISILPSTNRDPQVKSIRWREIRYNKYKEFKTRRLYLLGKVVEHEEKYYISTKINIPRSVSSLEKSSRWLEFTHPGLIYDLPDIDEEDEDVNTVTGTDSNNNAIRDDYELDIVFSDLEPETVDAALAAGKVYGDLIKAGVDSVPADEARAQEVLNKMIYAEQCKRATQSSGKEPWRDSLYFNTFERVKLKYKLQNMLAEMVDESELDLNNDDPCVMLQIN